MNAYSDSASVRACILTQVDLFSRLQPSALARIAAELEARTVGAGAEVCREGEESLGLYIITDGTFGVYVKSPDGRGEARLRTLQAGDHFGEMGLLTERPRSATVRADGEATVLALARSRFLQLLHDEPAVALTIMTTLSHRLKSVSTDVAEAKQARRDLLEANLRLEASQEKLKELDGLKSEFVLHVSHELRTPLATMQLSMDNLLDGVAGEVDSRIRRYLLRVKENAERLDRLVTDLLDLARIEAGRVQLRLADLSVRQIVEEVLDSVAASATAKGVGLAVEITDLRVWADRDKLQQVLINLIGNAVKFTSPGGRVVVSGRLVEAISDQRSAVSEDAGAQRRQGAEAIVSAESRLPHAGKRQVDAPLPYGGSAPLRATEGVQSAIRTPHCVEPLAMSHEPTAHFVEITVEDTGEGIPSDELEAIFDKFYQVRRIHQVKTPGAGLGLAITRSLVELQGGRIWAGSEIGKGSRFCFTLPASGNA